ncbi:MAG: beta-galactosidase, partial [Armatimonadota bacterium]
MRIRVIVIAALAALVAASPLYAAVAVTTLDPNVSDTPEGQRVAQGVVLANEVAHYTLNYDVIYDEETPDEVTSNWWAWQDDYITIGMTEPSRPNWYWQGFILWKFDDESLHMRPAEINVIRDGGQDGMVEYVWDTPKVRASLRFALATGSDKLLMFGSYEPKEPVEDVRMVLTCYPTGYAEPRNRAVTTALGTREAGETVNLDLEQERWVLYEDLTEGRSGQGPSGLLVGTPDAFESITVPVGTYGINTTLRMPGEATDFALGLYDFPLFPDMQETREYFGRSANAEAEQIEQMAAAGLDEPLPAMPMDEQRMARLQREGADMLDRPAELWRPDPEPLEFPWAADLAGGPVRTAIYCQRWRAWETMELARRMEMDADHIYFDTEDRLVSPGRWHYAGTTGIGALPQGVATRKAVEMATDETVDLFLVGAVNGTAMPGVAREAIVEQVADGAGLLITGPSDYLAGWPEEIFASEDPGLAEIALRGFENWDEIPGYREIDPGRLDGPPVRAWRYGEGRIVQLNVGLNSYSTLVPRNGAVEGLHAVTDRCLAIAARVALAAAGREMQGWQDADSVLMRYQDDLGRVLNIDEQEPEGGMVDLPGTISRPGFIDFIARNEQDETIGFGVLRAITGDWIAEELGVPVPALTDLAISPSTVTEEPAPPLVDMPEGGQVEASATVVNAPEGAQLQWMVRDIHDRIVAQTESAVQADASVTLELPRPMTPAHMLDVAIVQDGDELAYERMRFTMTTPYPFDDFSGLVWTYAGGSPILLNTDRLAYEWGCGMSDLCHVGGYSSEGAAREYAVSAQSGLRFIPYVTRYAGSANSENERVPCMHDPEYIAGEREKITRTTAQAAPYSPPAYTLGDENYLCRSEFECCHTEESVAAFREWLGEQYVDIAALNAQWGTDYADFSEITPITIQQAAERTESFAPWIDHKLFMDTAFAEMHELGASFVKQEDPDTKVGWDGFLGYNWKMGYDFAKLTENLELNQTYTQNFLQGELYRSFKRDDALTGKWGNNVADVEGGWHSFPWDCLLAGDNSVWWWTSWGVDYIPFNPDLSKSLFGTWFFESLEETRTGPGKLLLDAGREHSPIAVLYSHRDMFAAA